MQYYTTFLLDEETRLYQLLCYSHRTERQWFTASAHPKKIIPEQKRKSFLLGVFQDVFTMPDHPRYFIQDRVCVIIGDEGTDEISFADKFEHSGEHGEMVLATGWEVKEFAKLNLHPAIHDALKSNHSLLERLCDVSFEFPVLPGLNHAAARSLQ